MFLRTLITIFFMPVFLFGSGRGQLQQSTNAASGPDFVWFDVNRIGAWITNEGEFTSFRVTGNSGMEWPIGTGKTINFQSGIWIAGLVDGEIRTAVAEYVTEFRGGTYESYPDNPDTNRYRIYTIDNLSGPGDEDWDNWPAADGAPVDSNGDPLLLGDKMYWSVFHDADSTAHLQPFNTDPLGIEVRMTIWGYSDSGILGDVMYLNFQLFNKGNNLIDSAFVTLWADPDVGSAIDDLMGTDTLLQMAYAYNDGPDDVYGVAAPAIGFGLLQGLTVSSLGDTATSFGKKIPDYANSDIYATAHYIGGGGPGERDPETAFQAYSFMQGLNGLGEVKINDLGDTTRFSFTGDPVSGEGWIMTQGGFDIRAMVSLGPLEFAPGDSNEIIAAVVIGQGSSSLESITLLRESMTDVRTLHGIPVGIENDDVKLPSDFKLSQNYPNPFNPLTNIRYSLPVRAKVKLVIYNLRGQEVARLVDGERPAGIHSAVWDASDISSGIYFYRLSAGDYVKTRKMVLLK